MFSTTMLLRKQSTAIIKEKCDCYLLLEQIKKNRRCINNISFELSRLYPPVQLSEGRPLPGPSKSNSCNAEQPSSKVVDEGVLRTVDLGEAGRSAVYIEEENSQHLDSYYFRDK